MHRDLSTVTDVSRVSAFKAKLPKGDVHDTPHPYPLSAPLPEVDGEIEEVNVVDDGSVVRDRMHPGIISCAPTDTLAQAAKTMTDRDIHALVVIDDGKAVGVLSQTDIVLARQGRTVEEARQFTVASVMTAGCATVDIDAPLSSAITDMMKRRIHRLVVVEKGKPVGVLSMTDLVRRLME